MTDPVCEETLSLLQTLRKLGLKFRCPLEKIVMLQVTDGIVERVDTRVQRR